MTRDGNGKRVVRGSHAALGAVGSALGAMVALAAVLNWLGLPSPKEYRDQQAGIQKQLDEILGAVNDINRRLAAFGITDEAIQAEIRKRMLRAGP